MKCNIICNFAPSKTAQAMKDINAANIKLFEKLIAGADKIAIVTHMKPDGDAIGSSVAMYHFIKNLGKPVKIILNDPYPSYLSFLTPPQTKEDIIIWEDSPSMAKDEISGSGLLICLDFNAFHRTDRMESALAEASGKKILVDHHLNPSRELFDLSFSETETSSASELAYHILAGTSSIKGDASRLGAACREALMTGMTTDTNNFANSVFPSTLKMASALLEAGTDRAYILNMLYNQYGENRIRLMGHMMKDLLKITKEGAAYIVLDKKTQEEYRTEEGDTEGFVNMPLSIADVRMSILAKEDGEKIRISIRSKKGTSANMCAKLFFNGGGHENAAGGRLLIPEDIRSIDEAGRYIENATKTFLNNEEHI